MMENLTEITNETSDVSSLRASPTASVFSVSFYISLFLMWIPGTFLNALALSFIINDMKKARFPAIILLLLLCACDLLAVIFSCARHIILRKLSSLTYDICASISFMYGFFKVSGGVINSFMTVDRALAICAPFVYKKYVDVKTWEFGSLIAGITIAAYSAFPFVGLGDVVGRRRSGALYCTSLSFRKEPIERVYGMIFGFLGVLFILIIVIGNMFVIRQLLKLGNRVTDIATTTSEASATDGTMSGDPKPTSGAPFEIAVAKLMLCFSAAYLICGTPYNVQILLQQFDIKMDYVVTGYIHLLGGFTFTVDPIVYVLVRKSSRKRVMRWLCSCFKQR